MATRKQSGKTVAAKKAVKKSVSKPRKKTADATIRIGGSLFTLEQLQESFEQLAFYVDVHNLTPEQLAALEECLDCQEIGFQVRALTAGTRFP